MRKRFVLALLAAIATTPLGAQSTAVRYFSRAHLNGMSIKATVRQAATHPDWSCLPDKPYGFNAAYYAYLNPDVVEYFGSSEAGLYSHYVQFGRAEGRRPCDPRGGTTFDPSDSFYRTAPRNGTVSYVATVGTDTYDMGSRTWVDSRITIDGFDVDKDKLVVAPAEQVLGAPTYEELPDGGGTKVIWGGVVRLVLVGIPIDQAKAVVEKARAS